MLGYSPFHMEIPMWLMDSFSVPFFLLVHIYLYIYILIDVYRHKFIFICMYKCVGLFSVPFGELPMWLSKTTISWSHFLCPFLFL